jgi:hypothetical protein
MERVSRLTNQVASASPPPFPPAASDFFSLDDLLGEEEKRVRHRVRQFMTQHIPNTIVPYWEKAEFPHQIVPLIRQFGIIGAGIKGYGCPV